MQFDRFTAELQAVVDGEVTNADRIYSLLVDAGEAYDLDKTDVMVCWALLVRATHKYRELSAQLLVSAAGSDESAQALAGSAALLAELDAPVAV